MGIVMRCLEKALPRMSNAVVLSSSPEHSFKEAVSPTGCLQLWPFPDNNQPIWLSLKHNEDLPGKQPLQPKAATLCTNDATLDKISDAYICPQQQEEEAMAVQHVLRQHVDLFATDDNDLDLYKETEHAIELVRDASPYAPQPCRCGKKYRNFMERQCQVFHAQGLVTKTAQL
ncbi:hypothetical protein HPB51_029078 [Rhipicephalus microplus]|uniref:Uncharacterized protein n=1 Tax=Rhipicephalus microplus TaxID=6941 RepID=A0A9J6CVJ0_RHIMP|nr:hypothetical protein HPB51_029078 [Rhipicephalus microplus]